MSPQAEKALSRIPEPEGDGPVMVSQHDPLGNYTYVSPESQDVIGSRAEGLIGNSSADMVHEADVETVADAYALAIEGRRPLQLVCRVVDEEGEPRWIRCNFQAVDDEGKLLFVASTRRIGTPPSRRATFREIDEHP